MDRSIAGFSRDVFVFLLAFTLVTATVALFGMTVGACR